MPTATILIVEDDQDIREMLQSLLEDEGYGIWTAVNGRVALDLLRACPTLPGLVLLDLMMPVLDGEAFLREIKADERLFSLPVLMLTASHAGASFAADGFIRKPLDLDELLSSVERLIRRTK